nr:hypothetical protein HUO10_004729 [Paraburkholderia busanensis]
MKRVLSIIAFVAGGFAAEWAHPFQCALVSTTSTSARMESRKRRFQ